MLLISGNNGEGVQSVVNEKVLVAAMKMSSAIIKRVQISVLSEDSFSSNVQLGAILALNVVPTLARTPAPSSVVQPICIQEHI